MAPNLAKSQHDLIRDMILSNSLKNADMESVAGCSRRSIAAIRSNIRCFGTTKAPLNHIGRHRSINASMTKALRECLARKPDIYQDEMVAFLQNKFGRLVTTSSISRALASIGWSKKVTQRVAKQRNADLRDFYLHRLSDFRSYHLVYIDESGCDRRAGCRRTGWAPLGVTPVQVSPYRRERRYQILPAYAQDGVVLSRILQGPVDSSVFADFIEQLLQHCGKWPEPKSVLVMDNASFHRLEKIEQLCTDSGVKLVYLPPYSPDLNPIEEFFAELKAFIRKHWHLYQDLPYQDFGTYLEWCVDIVGSKGQSAKGHFRHAGLTVEDFDMHSKEDDECVNFSD
jgi:transposase